MPIISTNKPDLHKLLRRRVIDTGSTIGKTVDKFTEFGLLLQADALTEEEAIELKKLAKDRGMTLKGLLKLLQQ